MPFLVTWLNSLDYVCALANTNFCCYGYVTTCLSNTEDNSESLLFSMGTTWNHVFVSVVWHLAVVVIPPILLLMKIKVYRNCTGCVKIFQDSFGKSSSCDHKAHAFGGLGHCFLRGVPASYSEPALWEEENKKLKQSKPVAVRLSPTYLALGTI